MENPLLNTEKKKKTIVNIIYYALLLALFYCFMKYAFGLLAPFIIAFMVAMSLQRPVNFICRKTKLKKGLVSGVMVLLIAAAFIFLLVLIGVKIWEAFRDFIVFLVNKFSDMTSFLNSLEIWIIDKTKFLPDSVEKTINTNISSLIDSLRNKSGSSSGISLNISSIIKNVDISAVTNSLSGVWNAAKQIPSVFVAFIVSIFSCCFITADYDRLVNFVKRQFAGKSENVSKAKRIVTFSLKNLVKAYVLIILITFLEMFLGLSALKILGIYKGSWIFFISFGTAIVDIMPVLGTGTILWPWAFYSFVSGDVPMGIGILVIYVFISVMRQFIEPKLVAGQLGLPPFLTIMGMYIGIKLFGILGMFAVPLAIIFIKLLNDEGVVHLWKTSADAKKEKEEKAKNTEETENQTDNDGGNENESTEKV